MATQDLHLAHSVTSVSETSIIKLVVPGNAELKFSAEAKSQIRLRKAPIQI